MVTLLLDSVLVRRVSGHFIIGLCSGEEGELVTLLLDSVLVRRVSGHFIIGLCSGEEGEWSPYYWTLFW